MPVQNNNLADDPLSFDAQSSFTGGQWSHVRANLLSENQATRAVNTEVERHGTISQRRGFHRLGDLQAATHAQGGGMPQGLFWFDARAGGQYLLAVVGGKLYRQGASLSWTLVSATATGSATDQVGAVQLADQWFLAASDGTGRGRFWTSAGLGAGDAGTQITDGPADLSAIAALKYRIFGVNAALGDEVYCSTTLPAAPTPFTLAGQPIAPFRVGEGEGDPVVALVVWKGIFSMVALKRESVWLVDATPTAGTSTAATLTSGFSAQRVARRVGCMARRSVVVGGDDVFWLAEDGVRSLSRTIQDGDGEVSVPLSAPVHDLIERINPTYRHLACAAFWRGKYFLAVPIDASPVCNVVLVFDPLLKAWTVFDGVQPVQWAVASYAGHPTRLVCLDARGFVLEYRDHVVPGAVTADDIRDNLAGVPSRIPYVIRSRALAWMEPLNPKRVDFIELEFDRSEAIVDVDVFLDGDDGHAVARKVRTGFGTLVVPPDGSPDPWTGPAGNYFVLPCRLGELKVARKRFSLLQLPPTRELMVEIRESAELSTAEASESGILRLRSLFAGAYVDTLESQG